MYICVCMHMCVYVYVCICVYMCIYIYVYVYIYIYIYIHMLCIYLYETYVCSVLGQDVQPGPHLRDPVEGRRVHGLRRFSSMIYDVCMYVYIYIYTHVYVYMCVHQ